MLGRKRLVQFPDLLQIKCLSAEGSLPKFSTSTEGAGTLAGAECPTVWQLIVLE